jgi:mRNA interferase MazF
MVPITDSGKFIKDWHIELYPNSTNELSKASAADCFQVKLISKERFLKRMRSISENELNQVKLGLMKVLDLL